MQDEDLITEYVDRNGIAGDTKFLVDHLNQAYGAFEKLSSIKVGINGIEGMTQLISLTKEAHDVTKKYDASVKEHTQNVIAEAKAAKLAADAKAAEAKALRLAADAKVSEAKASKIATDSTLAEAKTREVNERAARKEAAEVEKAAKAKEAAAAKANDLSSRPIDSIPWEIKTGGDGEIDTKAIDARNEAMREQAILEAEAAGAIAANVNSRGESIIAVTKETEVINQQLDALGENVVLRNRLQNNIKEVNAALKEDAKALKAGTISQAEYNRRVDEGAIEVQQYKTKITELNKTIKTQIVDIKKEGSAYQQLVAAMNEAKVKAKDLAAQYGVNHQMSVQAIADAAALDRQVKAIDKSVGDAQRNVGNYGSAFGKAFGIVRQAANYIPGVGISGIFLAMGTGISNFIKALSLFDDAFDKSKASAKAYESALQDVGKATISSATPDTTKLELYRNILTDMTRSTQERTQALNAYNKIADEANQLDASQLNNINLINDKIAEQINLIEKRALSRAAESVLGNKAEALLLAKEAARSKAEKSFEADIEAGQIVIAEAYDARTKKFIKNSEEVLKWEKERIVSNRIATDEAVRNAQIEFDESKKALYGLIQLEGFTADAIKEQKEKKGKEGRDIDEANRKAAFEQLKSDLELEKDLQLRRSQDDSLSYTTRAAALLNFGLAVRSIIEAQAEFELNSAKLTAREREKIENDKNNAIVRANLDLTDRLKTALKGNFTIDTSKLGDQVKGITGAYATIFNTIKKQSEEAGKKIIDSQKQIRDAIKALAAESVALFVDIFKGNIEDEKNAVQAQIDLLEQRKLKDIELANQSIVNTQDRANAISIIEAKAAAQREQLEMRQRKLDQEKAKWDKAKAIAGIIQATALAVAEALPNIPLSILVGGLGAVQLARVMLTRIPQYFRGKPATDKYEGWAMVDDGGRPEVIERASGEVEYGSDKPRYTWLGKDDIVHPDGEAWMRANMISAGNNIQAGEKLVVIQNDNSHKIVSSINKMGRNIVQTIRNKKEYHPERMSARARVLQHMEGNKEYYRSNGFHVN